MAESAKRKAKVLVVGAGPTGLQAALCLARHGIPVRVIEKKIEARPGQRGAGLSARSMELLDFFGIAEELSRKLIRLPIIRIYKLPGGTETLKEVEMLPMLEATPDKPYPNYMCIGQETTRAFIEAKLNEYGPQVEIGVELQGLEDRGEQGVTATLVHNDDGGRIEEETFEYVIGADGAKGVTRKLLGFPFIGQTNIENFIIGDLEIEGLTMERWHQWGNVGDVLIGLRPTENDRVFRLILGGSNLRDNDNIIATPDNLKAFIKEHAGGRDDFQINNIICLGHYIVNIRMTETFGAGRIWLAGDAGHVHSMFGGQGMNTGLQDSFNLCWKLSLVLKGLAPPSLLESYNSERIPVVAEMLNLTTHFLKRNVKESTAEDSGWTRTEAIRQYGVNCRCSPIVIDEGGTGEQKFSSAYYPDPSGILYAGDRAPDATGLVQLGSRTGDAIRLFRILDPTRHTALLFSDYLDGQVQQIYSSLRRYPKELVRPVIITSSRKETRTSLDSSQYDIFEDKEGHARKAYIRDSGEKTAGIFIVRPDGTIGARLKGKELVEVYFRGIFGDYV